LKPNSLWRSTITQAIIFSEKRGSTAEYKLGLNRRAGSEFVTMLEVTPLQWQHQHIGCIQSSLAAYQGRKQCTSEEFWLHASRKALRLKTAI